MATRKCAHSEVQEQEVSDYDVMGHECASLATAGLRVGRTPPVVRSEARAAPPAPSSPRGVPSLAADETLRLGSALVADRFPEISCINEVISLLAFVPGAPL